MKHPLKIIERVCIRIEKRIRFVIATLLLTGVMLASTLFFFDKFWIFIPVLIVLTFLMTYFAILEGIEKIEWSMLFFVPVIWSVAAYLFYFLFPVRWITRLPFVFVYCLSLYALLLASNIFNVGVARSLQLSRAAFSVNYLYQTLIVFVSFNVLLSFRQSFLVNAVIVSLLVFPLSLQLFWSVRPKTYLEQGVKQYSMLVTVILVQLTIILSFIPLRSTIFALFAAAMYYSLTGILYHILDQKLFIQTIREYVIVAGFVFILLLLSIQW